MEVLWVYLPIYLLQLGFSLSTAVIYLMTHHVSILAGSFLAVFISNKIELVRCWYIRVVLLVLLFVGLHFLPTIPSFVLVLGMISGIESAFFLDSVQYSHR